MPNTPITDPDERQNTPAVIAAQLGWLKEFGVSWDWLLDEAEARYWRARERRAAA
jgi:hypothetical protein